MSQETNAGSTLFSCNDQNQLEEQGFTYLEHIITGTALPMVLKAAVELDLFGIIAQAGPGKQLSAEEIAIQLPTQANPEAASMVDRMLQLLTTYSVVTCSLAPATTGTVHGMRKRRYGLGPVAKYLVPDEDGLSLAPYIQLVQHHLYSDSWHKLKDAVLEGGVPFNKAHGTNLFEYASSNPIFNEDFNKGMFSYSAIVIKKILETYKGFENVKELVDVGGGLGHIVHAIVSKYPTIKGINFDLPHVIEQALSCAGVEHISGDMFENVPKGDAIFMKWILCDWGDDHCVKLLKNCYKALPENGKVIILEGVMKENPESSLSAHAISQRDAYMLTLMRGGRDRTREEFVALANAAGFVVVKFDCCVCNFWIIELYK